MFFFSLEWKKIEDCVYSLLSFSVEERKRERSKNLMLMLNLKFCIVKSDEIFNRIKIFKDTHTVTSFFLSLSIFRFFFVFIPFLLLSCSLFFHFHFAREPHQYTD